MSACLNTSQGIQQCAPGSSGLIEVKRSAVQANLDSNHEVGTPMSRPLIQPRETSKVTVATGWGEEQVMPDPLAGRIEYYRREVSSVIRESNSNVTPDWANIMDDYFVANTVLPFEENNYRKEDIIEAIQCLYTAGDCRCTVTLNFQGR